MKTVETLLRFTKLLFNGDFITAGEHDRLTRRLKNLAKAEGKWNITPDQYEKIIQAEQEARSTHRARVRELEQEVLRLKSLEQENKRLSEIVDNIRQAAGGQNFDY